MLRKTISKFLILFLSFTLLFAPTYSEAKYVGKAVTIIVVKKVLPRVLMFAGKKGGKHSKEIVFKYFNKNKKTQQEVFDAINEHVKFNPSSAKNASLLKEQLTNISPVLAKIKMRIPSNGHWSGEFGKSKFWPTSLHNNSKYDIKDLQKLVGKDGIPFKDGYPVFDKFRKYKIDVKDMTGIHENDVPKAAEALVNNGIFKNKTAAYDFARKNDLAWHHEPDGKVMSLVPNILHQNVIHDGGATFLRSIHKIKGN